MTEHNYLVAFSIREEINMDKYLYEYLSHFNPFKINGETQIITTNLTKDVIFNSISKYTNNLIITELNMKNSITNHNEILLKLMNNYAKNIEKHIHQKGIDFCC